MRKSNTSPAESNSTNLALYADKYEIIGNTKWNEDGTDCRFSIRLNGCINLYGLHLRYNSNTNEPFISFPSFKTNDGKYLNICYVKFSNATMESIVNELEAV